MPGGIGDRAASKGRVQVGPIEYGCDSHKAHNIQDCSVGHPAAVESSYRKAKFCLSQMMGQMWEDERVQCMAFTGYGRHMHT